ncbi:DUF3105 domain-containing protein [Trujillonella endophytica]|uniref:DUF3105 domain-containing protein n=1 Tax=Trujillonella endophytica TaxID=673521 RepID=A0A1H8TXS4_9ACTN|nr:DUF3105 domain-containing protein [Trujillella endophytica]SEO95822.1 Protein of unknown function [Trujillella endophytica]
MTARPRAAALAGAALLAGAGLAGCTSTVAGAASPAEGAPASSSVAVFDYAAGQQHVRTDVDYAESPPVGGPHDAAWADCTGTVYDVDIRHENAVHSLEHGAVWIAYDPDALSADDVATLADLVEGVPHRMLSPYAGLEAPISIQAWNHQLTVDSAGDPRLAEFADELTQGPGTPELGATCQNPDFLDDPELV